MESIKLERARILALAMNSFSLASVGCSGEWIVLVTDEAVDMDLWWSGVGGRGETDDPGAAVW